VVISHGVNKFIYFTDRIGGAQLATITFLAPTSLAICTISFDVVPRTIESSREGLANRCLGLEVMEDLPSTNNTFLLANSRAIAFSFFRTFFCLFEIRTGQQHKNMQTITSFVDPA